MNAVYAAALVGRSADIPECPEFLPTLVSFTNACERLAVAEEVLAASLRAGAGPGDGGGGEDTPSPGGRSTASLTEYREGDEWGFVVGGKRVPASTHKYESAPHRLVRAMLPAVHRRHRSAPLVREEIGAESRVRATGTAKSRAAAAKKWVGTATARASEMLGGFGTTFSLRVDTDAQTGEQRILWWDTASATESG